MNEQVKKIAEEILGYNSPLFNRYGLLNGKIGEIFFLYYYSLIDNSYKKIADELLEQLIDDISSNNTSCLHTYCGGLAGLGIALLLLKENGFVDSAVDLFDDIDPFLSYKLEYEINLNHYDFLHGALGVGFYFLKRNESGLPELKKMLNYLEKSAIVDQEKGELKWKSIDHYRMINKTPEAPYNHADFNISLSHGMSSIVIFLAQLIRKDIMENEKNIEMLNMAVNYILSQRLDHKKYGSYFPSHSIESDEVLGKSRLGWCYGDLGVAIALLQAGKVLNRGDLIDLSVEIMTFSALRRNLSENIIVDAGICHGSSGVSQIFFRMYKETGMKKFFDAYQYWQSVTLKLAYHPDGLAGYKAYGIRNNAWHNDSGILEGVAGIGLSMLSPLNCSWDEILLLNFK